MSVARGAGGVAAGDLPFPSEVVLFKVGLRPETMWRSIEEVVKGLGGSWEWKWNTPTGLGGTGVGFVARNTWSRAARRKGGDGEEEGDEMAFGYRIYLRRWMPANGEGSARTEVVVRWLKGEDSVLFESFCGMIKRKVYTPLSRDEEVEE